MKDTKVSLLPVLGLTTAILLVAGNMIGSGVFKKIAPMSSSLMSETMVLFAWFAAGLITMLGAFTFASLATTTNEAGGQFQYFKNIFGGFFGFMYGWSFFAVISTASIASIVYVFAESVSNFFGLNQIFTEYANYSLFGGVIFPFKNATVKIIAITTLVLLTAYNIRGVKGGGWLSNVVTTAKIAGILMLIIIGFTYTSPASGIATIVPFVSPSEPSLSAMLQASAFFTAMLGAFWAYDGWVNITNMASEFKNPTRNIPIAIIAGTAITVILYIVVNYAYFQVLTPAQFATLYHTEGTIAAVEVARTALGQIGVIAISVLIMISTFGATQGSTMSASRVYYQMSKEGYFFAPFAKIHAKFHTPHISLIGQMIWASILIISGTFDQLTDMLIFAAFLFYGLGAIAVMKLKRNGHLKISFGYPFVPIAFMLLSLVIVVNAIYSRPLESLMGLGLMATGVPLYLYFKIKNKI